jgi:hypothetical protein
VRHHAVTDVDLILRKEDFTAAARIGLGEEHRAFIVSLVEESARVGRVAATKTRHCSRTSCVGKDLTQIRVHPSRCRQGSTREWEVEGAGSFAVSPAGGGEPTIWDATSRTYRVVNGKVVELKGEGEE